MARLRIKVANLQDESDRRVPEGKRPMKWVVSPPQKSIVENINEEVGNFHYNYHARF
jgi:hypothetical protein